MSYKEESFHVDIPQLKRRIAANKGVLTQKINLSRNVISLANSTTPPTASAVSELEACREAVKTALDRLQCLYVTLMEYDVEDHLTRNEQSMGVENSRALEILNQIAAAIQRGAQRQPSRNSASSQTSDQVRPRVKANDALKPFILTRDHTPVEMRTWLRKFKSYYSSSNMKFAPLADQQAYFRNCIDSYLDTRINGTVREDTPIYREGDDTIEITCEEIIVNEFAARFPILTRRYLFFKSEQESNQLCSDWVASLRALEDEANLADMTTEQLYVMKIICGTKDAKLREKFLKEDKPTMDIINKIIGQHESITTSVKTITNQDVPVNRVQNQNKSQGGRAGQSLNNMTRQELIKRGHCSKCGFPDCDRSRCRAANATCNYNGCNRKGHFWRMCIKHDLERQQGLTRARQVMEGSTDPEEEPHGEDDMSEVEEHVMAVKIRSISNHADVQACDKEPWMTVKIEDDNTSFTHRAIQTLERAAL